MRLNDFGKEVRVQRVKYNVPLKHQAEAMGISSAHLSALEYGDKQLNPAHIQAAISFFRELGADNEVLLNIREAGDRSINSINLSTMDSDAKSLVIAFARSLQEGREPNKDIIDYLKKRK